MINISGTISKIFFSNPEGWHVLTIQTNECLEYTITGIAPPLEHGQTIRCTGEWHNHPKFGKQLKCTNIEPLLPETADGVVKYLTSTFAGIGEKKAIAIVEQFGAENVFDVFHSNPEKLLEVKGIGRSLQRDTAQKFKEVHGEWAITVILRQNGLGATMATKVFNFFKKNVLDFNQEFRRNPYILMKIEGINFKKADAIAQAAGVSKDSEFRLREGLVYVMSQSMAFGDCAIASPDLLEKCQRILQTNNVLAIENSLSANLQADQLIAENGFIYLPQIYQAEQFVAERIAALSRVKLPHLSNYLNEQLTPEQNMAVRTALTHQVSVITGGPGTGKTTVLKMVLANLDGDTLLCAPTGKAAKRMKETTEVEAYTLHRAMLTNTRTEDDVEVEVEEDENGEQKSILATCDTLIIDEFSMVDIQLMAWVLSILSPNAKLILVGDVGQLPSIGPGYVLADIINSGIISVTKLTQIMRQKSETGIPQASKRVSSGLVPESSLNVLVESLPNPEKMLNEVLSSALTLQKMGYDYKEIQILSPMRKHILGVENLNAELQKLFNGYNLSDRKKILEYKTVRFVVGDKVIQNRNNYQKGVMNGESGIIRLVAPVDQEITVQFEGPEGNFLVAYSKDEIGELSLSYALTVHKSQGSEYRVVIVVLANQHYMLLQRNLLYTAISRGKERLIIVNQQEGFKDALLRAVKNNSSIKRTTFLAAKIMSFGTQAMSTQAMS